MNETPPTESILAKLPGYKLLAAGALAVVLFLLGYLPMWMHSRGVVKECNGIQQELRLVRLENLLASATIDARRGEYEPARQAVSQFYSLLSTEIDPTNNSRLSTAQKQQLSQMHAKRDDLITLLARNDPASAERLTDLFLVYRQSLRPPSAPVIKSTPP